MAIAWKPLAFALGVAMCCERPAYAQGGEPAAPVAAARRSRVLLCLRAELSAQERAVLSNLLEPEFRRRGVALVLESSELDARSWVAQRRADESVLLLAILKVVGSRSWQLTIIDAARGRAIARSLPGGVDANAAVVEAVASIISSAASALSDGLEVASQPIDDVVVPQAAAPEPPPAPPLASSKARSPPFVRSSLGAVLSSFAAEAPAQLGFAASLGFGLGSGVLRLSGARYLPAEVKSTLGSFSIGRTAFGLGFGWGMLRGRFELDLELSCAFEVLRRGGAQAARDVDASPGRSLYRLGPLADLRLRYDLGSHVALESVVGGYYFAQRIRFLAENPAATSLVEPWAGGFTGQLAIEVRAP